MPAERAYQLGSAAFIIIRAKRDISQFDPLANDPILGIVRPMLYLLRMVCGGNFPPVLGDEQ